MEHVTPSPLDDEYYRLLRANVVEFMRLAASYAGGKPQRLLDVAPQDHEGARPFFPANVTVETLDIDPRSRCTYVGDLCTRHPDIPDGHFDLVVCTEVLEHVLAPLAAVQEVHRVLKPGGMLFVSTPFNFRIHGPLPDCWRFTEHGLRALLSAFEIVRLDALPSPGRPLMPIHYTVVARKPLGLPPAARAEERST